MHKHAHTHAPRLKNSRESVKDLVKEFDDTENALKALQSIGQIIGEVLKQLDDTRFIVKVCVVWDHG